MQIFGALFYCRYFASVWIKRYITEGQTFLNLSLTLNLLLCFRTLYWLFDNTDIHLEKHCFLFYLRKNPLNKINKSWFIVFCFQKKEIKFYTRISNKNYNSSAKRSIFKFLSLKLLHPLTFTLLFLFITFQLRSKIIMLNVNFLTPKIQLLIKKNVFFYWRKNVFYL